MRAIAYHPQDTAEAASLGIELVSTLIIRNDGTGTEARGNYVWGFLTPEGKVESHGRIVGHPRQDGAWALVRKVLERLWVSPSGLKADTETAQLGQFAAEETRP